MREEGTIVRWLSDRGFGFAKPDDAKPGGRDIFVAASRCRGDASAQMEAGTRISFERRTDAEGRQFAHDVTVESAVSR